MLSALLCASFLFYQGASALDAGCKWSEGFAKLGISGYNNVYKEKFTVDQCKAACESETSFKCRSFDFYNHWLWGTGCYLSDVDTYVAPIVTWNDYTYYEIVCDNDPRSRADCPFIGPITKLGISGNNLVTVSAASVDECKAACKSEKTFHCKSFDYHRTTKHCYLQVVDRETVPLAAWADYDYYELTCEPQTCEGGTWSSPVANLGISGNNLKQLNSVSVDQCKSACEKEVAFKCRSFDYYTPSSMCYLQSVTSLDIPLTTWNAYNYYELSGCNGKAVNTIRTLSCYCIGDPHCYSFDGIRADFMGTCKYTLARDNCEDGLPKDDPTWEVIINPDRNYPTEPVSRVRGVSVILDDYDLVIDMFAGLRVSVNNVPVMGYPHSPNEAVTIIRTWTSVYVTVKKGIQVTWDGNTRVGVQAPDSMKSTMCGICGDADGSTDNDWTIGDSNVCMDSFPDAKAGETTTNVNEFGFSWTHSIDANEKSCSDSCPNPPNPDKCPAIQEQKAEAHCKPLTDASGPFKDCLAKMPDAQKKDLFDNCVYDSCHLNDYETVVCEHAASMSKICQFGYEMTVSWRSEDLCPMECGEGMEYKACGNICMPTCSDRDGTKCGDTDGCEEGCFCKEGTVYDGVGSCYSDDKCGCKVPDQGGVYVNVGTSYMTEDCSQECTCETAGGDLVCKSNVCGANKVCSIRDGVRACYCDDPYVLDGKSCIKLESPCKTSDTARMMCFTCTADSEEECRKTGEFRVCTDVDPICTKEVTTMKESGKMRIERHCGPRDLCSHASLGRDGQDCSDTRISTVCKQCDFGVMDEDHVCKEPVAVSVCGQIVDQGTGTQSLSRYFFRADKGKCAPFTYKGQGGNGNNFSTQEQCEETCKNAEIPEECLHEPDTGTGSNFSYHFYFNAKVNLCKKFRYSGMGGNANNFKKKEDCAARCKKY